MCRRMAREGPGGGSAFAAVCACLHTGIIYHNISLRARLLIISFSVGTVGSGKKSRLVGISKSLCMHVRGADAKKVNGLRRCCGGSSCEEETAVWCAEAVSVCVCVCVRAWVPIFLCTCTNTCVDRCTVPRGEKVTHTHPPPRIHVRSAICSSQHSSPSCHLSPRLTPPFSVLTLR